LWFIFHCLERLEQLESIVEDRETELIEQAAEAKTVRFFILLIMFIANLGDSLQLPRLHHETLNSASTLF